MDSFMTIMGVIIFASFISKFIKTTFKIVFFIIFPIYISYICNLSYSISFMLFIIVGFAVKEILKEFVNFFKLLFKSRKRFKEGSIEKLSKVLFICIYTLFIFICYTFMVKILLNTTSISTSIENIFKIALILLICRFLKPIMQKI